MSKRNSIYQIKIIENAANPQNFMASPGKNPKRGSNFKRFKSLRMNSLLKEVSPAVPYKHKITSLNEIENLAENISIIIVYFLDNHPTQTKVETFLQKYNDFLGGGYLDLLLVMKEFPEFNIFDFLLIPSKYNENITLQEVKKKKQLIITRNNIFLSILVVAKELEECEINGEIDFGQSEPLFSDLRFLNNFLEKFKNLLVEIDTRFDVELDVEMLFFGLLGYKDKSRIIKQKFHAYFKKFIDEIGPGPGKQEINLNDFINVTIDKQRFSDFTDNELMLYRKILNNAIQRNFYFGIEYLLKNPEFCLILSEGRIWKNIGRCMEHYKTYNLWSIYEESIEDVRTNDTRETLSLEYEDKLKDINEKINQFIKKNKIENIKKLNIYNDEYNELVFRKKGLLKEIYLYTVTSLKELFVIFFRYELKELVLYFFDEYKNERGETKIPIDIYEICLEYDEDISIYITERAVVSSTAKSWYMEAALLRKYFRLAAKLLQFNTCRECLVESSIQSNEYMAYVSKLQVSLKNKLFEKTKYQKNDEDVKIIDFIQDKDSIASSEKKSEMSGSTLTKANLLNDNLIKNFSREKLAAPFVSKKTLSKNDNHISRKIIGVLDSPIINGNSHKERKVMKLRDNKNDKDDKGDKQNCNDSKEDISIRSFIKHDQHNLITTTITPLISNNRNRYAAPLEPLKNLGFQNKKLLIGTQNRDMLGEELNGNLSKIKLNSCVNLKKMRHSAMNFQTQVGLGSHVSHKGISALSTNNLMRPSFQSLLESSAISGKFNNDDFFLERTKTDEDKIQELKEGKFRVNIQMLLIDNLSSGVYLFDVLCLLSSIPARNIRTSLHERICGYLLLYTTNDDAIVKCPQPLISIAMGAELLIKIGKINNKIKFKAETTAFELLRLGESIQSSMKDEDMLNYYLREQCDHHGRSALEIYAENRFYNLLSNMNVGIIVGKLWYGSGYEQSIFKFFRLTRILYSNIVNEHYEPLVRTDYLPKNSVYTFQFYQYAKNCSVRNIFESISVLIITLLYQYIIYAYVTFTKEDVYHPTSHYYYKVQIFTNLLMLLSLLNYLFLHLYFHKTGRKVKLNLVEAIINVTMFLGIIANLVDLPEKVYPVIEDPDKNILGDGIIYSVLITMGWMKVVIILMTTNTYGPFIRIMFNIFWHVFIFILVFFSITFCFAQVFTLFFKKSNSDFYEFYDSFVMLFNTAFGQVFFNNFTSLDLLGYIALMAYSTLSNVMLFNLIVAIINNLFNDQEERADAENRAVLILTHERIKWDDRYGLLILLPSPLNSLALFFIPWLFIFEDHSKALNLAFSKICYFFVALILFFFLIILGLVIYPFVLVKSLVHSSYDTWILHGKNRCRAITISFFTRPFILLFYIGADCFTFWKLVYLEPKNFYDEENEHKQYLHKYIMALRKVLNDVRFKEKRQTLTLRELYSKLSIFKKKKKLKTLRNESLNDFNNTGQSETQYEKTDKMESVSSKEDAITKKSLPQNINSTSKVLMPSLTLGNDKKKKGILQEEMKLNFRKIIDKIVDPEGFIDIERTLSFLPDRAMYSEEFIENLNHMSIRVIIRGLMKYFFINVVNNPVYSFKKLQLLMYKMLLKVKLIYSFFPQDELSKIGHDFEKVNLTSQFAKNPETLQKYEKIDDVSEYDDDGEYADFSKSSTNNGRNSTNVSQIGDKISVTPKESNDSSGFSE